MNNGRFSLFLLPLFMFNLKFQPGLWRSSENVEQWTWSAKGWRRKSEKWTKGPEQDHWTLGREWKWFKIVIVKSLSSSVRACGKTHEIWKVLSWKRRGPTQNPFACMSVWILAPHNQSPTKMRIQVIQTTKKRKRTFSEFARRESRDHMWWWERERESLADSLPSFAWEPFWICEWAPSRLQLTGFSSNSPLALVRTRLVDSCWILVQSAVCFFVADAAAAASQAKTDKFIWDPWFDSVCVCFFFSSLLGKWMNGWMGNQNTLAAAH